jgi:hypothetical protein
MRNEKHADGQIWQQQQQQQYIADRDWPFEYVALLVRAKLTQKGLENSVIWLQIKLNV